MFMQKKWIGYIGSALAVWALAACAAAAKPAAAPAAPAAPTTAAATEAAPAAAEEIARPSNPGGPGEAVKLTGDAAAGAKIYVDQCKKCHGEEGKGGVNNPGSTDGTIPELNPIDSTLIDKDASVTISNIDLFIEHGSTPGGSSPKEKMAAFGDEQKLTAQQIADVIAYVVSLNKK